MNEDASDATPTPDDFIRRELIREHDAAVKRGDAERAEACADALVRHDADVAAGPSPPELLMGEAARYETAGDWPAAEATYRKALDLAIAEDNPYAEYHVHESLSKLYAKLGRDDESFAEAVNVLDAARRCPVAHYAFMAMSNMVPLRLKRKEPELALAVADELVAAMPANKLYESRRARALVLRARCRLGLGYLAGAEEDLTAAWPLFGSLSNSPTAAGVQGAIANWWNVTAQLETKKGNLVAAATAHGKEVEHRYNVARAPQHRGPEQRLALADALQRLGDALLAVDEKDGAAQAFERRRTILESLPPTNEPPTSPPNAADSR